MEYSYNITPLYFVVYACLYKKEVNVMPNKKQTSATVASKASHILKSNKFSKTSKSVAGSALSQTRKK
jgi:hypothetical protein